MNGLVLCVNYIAMEHHRYQGITNTMHTHKVARACLGFQPGVRDFRRDAGAWNMEVVFTSKVQLARFLIIISPKIFI